MTRVLLDEDVPVRLRHQFPEDVQVETVAYRGWKGLENGALLRAAAEVFDVLVTVDNNLPDQQNVSVYDLMVLILRPRSKRMADLLPLMPDVIRYLDHVHPGSVIRIFPPGDEKA